MKQETREELPKAIDQFDAICGEIAAFYCEEHRVRGKRRVDALYKALIRMNEAADLLEEYMESEKE